MKTGEGTYLTHVLKGTQSEQCRLARPHWLHYRLKSRLAQYTRSDKQTRTLLFRLSLSHMAEIVSKCQT